MNLVPDRALLDAREEGPRHDESVKTPGLVELARVAEMRRNVSRMRDAAKDKEERTYILSLKRVSAVLLLSSRVQTNNRQLHQTTGEGTR